MTTTTDAATILRDALTKIGAAASLNHTPLGVTVYDLANRAIMGVDALAAERAAIQPAGEATTVVPDWPYCNPCCDYEDPRGGQHDGRSAHCSCAEAKASIARQLAVPIPQEAKAEHVACVKDWYREYTCQCTVCVPTTAASSLDLSLIARLPLPETTYNACGDGSEPLYTPEMVYEYANKHIVAMAHARAPELNKALEHIAKLEAVIRSTTPAAPEGDSEAGELPPLFPKSAIGWKGQSMTELAYGHTDGAMSRYGQLCRDTAPSRVTSAPAIASIGDDVKKPIGDQTVQGGTVATTATMAGSHAIKTASASGSSIGDDAEFRRILDGIADMGKLPATWQRIVDFIDARSPVAAAPECACDSPSWCNQYRQCHRKTVGFPPAPTASTPPAPDSAQVGDDHA